MSLTAEQIDGLIDRELEVLPVDSIRKIMLDLAADLDRARAFAAAWKRAAKSARAGLRYLALANVELRQEIVTLTAPPPERIAKRVQDHVFAKYLLPARERGHKTAEVAPLEVHTTLKLTQRYASVISAMTSKKFLDQHHVRIRNRRYLGGTKLIVYELEATE